LLRKPSEVPLGHAAHGEPSEKKSRGHQMETSKGLRKGAERGLATRVGPLLEYI
jgi:hypothetical protein